MSFVAFLYGGFFALLGLTMLLHAPKLQKPMAAMMQSDSNRLAVNGVLLPLGLAGTWFHNDWTMGPGLVVTLLAWLICLRMFVLILLPDHVDRAFANLKQRFGVVNALRGGGAVLLLAGLLAFWQAYMTRGHEVGMDSAFVAFLYAGVFGIFGLVALLHPYSLKTSVEGMVRSVPAIWATLYMFLPLGLAGVYYHNDWSMGPGLAVTLLAWIILLKSLFLLFLAPIALRLANWWMTRFDMVLVLRLDGILMGILGLLCLWQAWRLCAVIPLV